MNDLLPAYTHPELDGGFAGKYGLDHGIRIARPCRTHLVFIYTDNPASHLVGYRKFKEKVLNKSSLRENPAYHAAGALYIAA